MSQCRMILMGIYCPEFSWRERESKSAGGYNYWQILNTVCEVVSLLGSRVDIETGLVQCHLLDDCVLQHWLQELESVLDVGHTVGGL